MFLQVSGQLARDTSTKVSTAREYLHGHVQGLQNCLPTLPVVSKGWTAGTGAYQSKYLLAGNIYTGMCKVCKIVFLLYPWSVKVGQLVPGVSTKVSTGREYLHGHVQGLQDCLPTLPVVSKGWAAGTGRIN